MEQEIEVEAQSIVEESQEQIEAKELKRVDEEFLAEYNKLVHTYNRALVPQFTIQRVTVPNEASKEDTV